MLYLVADVGGTNTRIAVYENQRCVRQQKYVNANLDSFSEGLSKFLESGSDPVDAVVVGVAGPVAQGRVRMTNLGWEICENSLQEDLKVPVKVLNDFHIQALGTLTLGPAQFSHVNQVVTESPQRIAVLGPGTGLGEAFVIAHETGWVVIPGEGGHKRFAPRNVQHDRVLNFLRQQHAEHVSIERVVSGPGLVNIYNALSQFTEVTDPITSGDIAHEISKRALEGHCRVCRESLDVFVDVLADEAANLALQISADCVYLSGGIPQKIAPVIQERFAMGFCAKGRYRKMLQKVDVRLVVDGNVALNGAVLAAEPLLESRR